jgi:enterochelin esterase-like enzyme
VVSIEVPGIQSRLTGAPALVYLPAQYGDPAYANRTFPVVELLSGFPGTPRTWTGILHVESVLNREIQRGSAVPFIAVIPTQNIAAPRDTECVDVAGGPKVDTYLTYDVRSALEAAFRVDRNSRQWTLMGYSTGGYCAANLAMRHPRLFHAAVSLSGYNRPAHDRSTGDLFRNNRALLDANDVVWRATHLPIPSLDILMVTTKQDLLSLRSNLLFEQVARPPLRLWDLTLPRGGHNGAVWQAELPTAFSWLSRFVSAPLAPVPSVGELLPQLTHPKPVSHAPSTKALGGGG